MHDGAPPHFSRITRQYLNDHSGKWVGRNGAVAWPPRSPDLNPIDLYLWGQVKNEVYSTRVTDVDELWERIVATFDAIRNRPGQLERVKESMMRRLNGCVAAVWTSYVILKRVPAHERKSLSQNLFTFGPMLIGMFLLDWGWGIPRNGLCNRFWGSLYNILISKNFFTQVRVYISSYYVKRKLSLQFLSK